MRASLVAIAGLCVLADAAVAQNASPYRPGRLGDIVARYQADLLASAPVDAPESVLTGETEPTIVEATFTGQARPIGEMRRQFIDAWARSHGQDPRWAAAYTEEWSFRADSAEYWLAVQDVTAESMRPLVRAGSPITLYTRWLGARVDRGAIDWIFLLIRAESPGDEPAGASAPDA